MALSDLLRWLESHGCEVQLLPEIDDHVLLTRGSFRAILPRQASTSPPAEMAQAPLPYSVTLTPDSDGTIVVTFPDFPGATYGRDEADALARAAAFLRDAVRIYEALDIPVPPPPPEPRVRRGSRGD